MNPNTISSGEIMKTLNGNSYATRAILANVAAVASGVISRMAADSLTINESNDLDALVSMEVSRQINNRKED